MNNKNNTNNIHMDKSNEQQETDKMDGKVAPDGVVENCCATSKNVNKNKHQHHFHISTAFDDDDSVDDDEDDDNNDTPDIVNKIHDEDEEANIQPTKVRTKRPNDHRRFESTDSSSIIQRLLDKIEGLEGELSRIKQERDVLYSENERLCFQLQMINEADKQRSSRQASIVAPGDVTSGYVFNGQCPYNVHHHYQKGTYAQASSGSSLSCQMSTATTTTTSMTMMAATMVENVLSSTSSLVSRTRSTSTNNRTITDDSTTSTTITTKPLQFHKANNCNCPILDNSHHHHESGQSCSCCIDPNRNIQMSYNYGVVNNNYNANPPPSSLPLERSLSTHSSLNKQSMQLSPTSQNFFFVTNGGSGGGNGGNIVPGTPGSNSNGIAGAGNCTSASNLSRTTRATGGSTTSLASNSISFNSNGYEISQQLIDKKVSALERKYGGQLAREAAIKIQRAYRSYRLQKRFTSLAIQAIHHKQKHRDHGQQNEPQPNRTTTQPPARIASSNHHRGNCFVDNIDNVTSSSHNNLVGPLSNNTDVFYCADTTNKATCKQQKHCKKQNTVTSRAAAGAVQFGDLVNTTADTSTVVSATYGHQHHQQQPTPSIIYSSSGGGAGDNVKRLQKKTSFSSTSSTGSSGASSTSLQAAATATASLSTASSTSMSKTTPTTMTTTAAHSSSNKMSQDSPFNHNHHHNYQNSSSTMSTSALTNDHRHQQHHQAQLLSNLTQGNQATQNKARMSKKYSQSQSSILSNNSGTGNVYKNVMPLSQCPAMSVGPTGAVMFNSSVEYAATNQSMSSSATSESLVANAADIFRKRLYRVGLNLFNKTPSDRGIRFLIGHNFIEQFASLEEQAKAVAMFLFTRKGVSRQMIGEYLSENNVFNKAILNAFVTEINLQGYIVDEALRLFQSHFRFPGEAQKIERLVEAFADRYKECNPNDVLSRDSIFILAFAIIMLNTDLHKPTNMKHRMTPEQWLTNLKGVFTEGDLSSQFLLGVYKRIKKQELQTGGDHVTQVLKVQSTIVGKDVPNLCLPHRRLVCYCRLYEIRDINRKEKIGQHQRDVFLFNDLLLITKTTNRSRNNQLAEYQYRSSITLDGLNVSIFSKGFYAYGIRICRRVDQKCIAMFNARNELDQKRFMEDLRESIAEMDEMEQIRITKSSSLVQLNNFMVSNNEFGCMNSNVNNTTNNHNNRRNTPDDVTTYSSMSSIAIASATSSTTCPTNGHETPTAGIIQSQNH